ncbi:MAG: FIG00452441: hypothetical protein [uncultured Paraburkholderia sp.]|uniref:hypothetical protein n=1 Tax=uncultured Paraburkholderia sp. TaxID=1822466 RepID=UPI0025998F40|nr:hypothetical protein [uncultured Paraburkholderia sp.]CAH2893239.1 MAG: FIG00452441: hypothetical protein [uncultured Paraburkholderia sp.]CAH2908464.1 MAG: FIG00452441: hypothetical protein [uncultured Paraburkholderia sp.]
MKIRIVTIACAATAAALLAACTAVYKNSDACEQLMRSKLAEQSTDPLKIGHTGAGIDGSRVVVEGSIEHVMTASEVAAASARAAPGVRAGRRMAASGVGAASSVSQAASTVTASEAGALARKSTKPKKLILAAAAECTFHGPTLDTFSWLAPAKLAAPSDPDASEADE